MTQDNFMNVLWLIVLSGLLIYFVIALSKKWLPATAICPFGSFSEIKSYYLSSISIIRKNLWLLLLPLGLVLSQYLLTKFFTFSYFQSDLSNIPEDTINVVTTLLSRPFSENLIKSFLHMPQMLYYGFNSSISQNIIFIAFFLICSITYKGEIRKLKKNSTNENLVNVAFINGILKSSLLTLIGVVLLLGIIYLLDPLESVQIFCYAFIGISILVLSLLCISIFSLLEAFILFSVKEAIQPEGLKQKEILNKSLGVIKPLFIINIILYFVGVLSSLMMLPTTISQFFELGDTIPYNLIIFSQKASVIYSYFSSFLMIFIFIVPFALINFHTGAFEAFKRALTFIRDFLVKYLSFVSLGIVILFIPSFINILLNLFVNPYSIYSFSIEIFTIFLRITFAVIFYIAMFKFFHDNSVLGNT